jgi:tRNA pseudouridine38-40 synthase
MQQYKLTIAYDGTQYHGWQVQPDATTVAGVLQAQFQKVFGMSITLIGASRTDAGVHAVGQVAMFRTDMRIEAASLKRAWNGGLPSDILIRSLEAVPADFHVQRNVQQKTYWYHIAVQRPLPFFARYCLYYRLPFDVKKFEACLQEFVGTHDFRSFCTGDEQESTVRTVDAIHLEYRPEYQAYRVVVRGPGFLRYMIRRMVGAALHVATYKHFSHADLREIFAAKNPQHCLPTAPAQGLMLRKIIYKKLILEGVKT